MVITDIQIKNSKLPKPPNQYHQLYFDIIPTEFQVDSLQAQMLLYSIGFYEYNGALPKLKFANHKFAITLI